MSGGIYVCGIEGIANRFLLDDPGFVARQIESDDFISLKARNMAVSAMYEAGYNGNHFIYSVLENLCKSNSRAPEQLSQSLDKRDICVVPFEPWA